MDGQTYTWAGNATNLHGDDLGLYACNGCGALVLDEDKRTHDNFHAALAQLWDTK